MAGESFLDYLQRIGSGNAGATGVSNVAGDVTGQAVGAVASKVPEPAKDAVGWLVANILAEAERTRTQRPTMQDDPLTAIKRIATSPVAAMMHLGDAAHTAAGVGLTDYFSGQTPISHTPVADVPVLGGLAQALPVNIVPSALQGMERALDRSSRVGSGEAGKAAQFEYDRAPEQVPGQKFLGQQALDPTTYLAGGTGTALTRGAERVAAANLPRAVQPAATAAEAALRMGGAGATAYDTLAGAPFRWAQSGAGAALEHLPVVGPAFQQSKRGQAAFHSDATQNVMNQGTATVEDVLQRAGLTPEQARAQAPNAWLHNVVGADLGEGPLPGEVAGVAREMGRADAAEARDAARAFTRETRATQQDTAQEARDRAAAELSAQRTRDQLARAGTPATEPGVAASPVPAGEPPSPSAGPPLAAGSPGDFPPSPTGGPAARYSAVGRPASSLTSDNLLNQARGDFNVGRSAVNTLDETATLRSGGRTAGVSNVLANAEARGITPATDVLEAVLQSGAARNENGIVTGNTLNNALRDALGAQGLTGDALEQARSATYLHWLDDRYGGWFWHGKGAQDQMPAAAQARLAREQGAPPISGGAVAEPPPVAPPAAPDAEALLGDLPAAGTNDPAGLRQEILDAQRSLRIVRAESGDPADHYAAVQRLRQARQAYDEATRAATFGPPLTPPEPTVSAVPPDLLAQARQDLLQGLPAYTPEAFADIQQNVRRLLPDYQKDLGSVEQLMGQHGLEGSSLRDLGQQLDQRVRTEPAMQPVRQTINALNAKYHGADVLGDSEQTLLMARYLHDYATQTLGLQPKQVQKVWGDILGSWRSLALLSPRYHANNVLDALFKSMVFLHGNGFNDPVGNLRQSVGRAFADSDAQGATGLLTRGLRAAGATPESDLPAVANVLRESTGLPFRNEVYKGGLTTETTGRLDNLPVLGGALRLNRGIAQGIEQSARQGAYLKGYQQYGQDLVNGVPRLAQLADTIDMIAPGTRQAVLDTNGLVGSPERLRAILGPRDPAATQSALRALLDYRKGADQAGIDLAHKLHFDYRDTSNLDEALRQFTAFHLFATRNLPLYGELLATHPAILRGLQSYDQMTDQYAKQEGIDKAQRFEGAVPLGGIGRGIASVLFGINGESLLNPSRYLSIVPQVFDQPFEQKAQTGLGGVLAQTQRFGIGLHPWIQAALAPTGAVGAGQPQTLLPTITPLVNSAVQTATGQPFNLEGPLDWLQRQRMNDQPTPTDPKLYVMQRLAQMSLQAHPELGGRVAPEYQAAMAEGPTNALWQQAQQSMGRQKLGESLASFAGVPLKGRPDSEAAIEQARVGLPDSRAINAEGGRTPLEPILRKPGTDPNAPLLTGRMIDQRLAQRVAGGFPEAAAYEQPFQLARPPSSGAGTPSHLDQVKQETILRFLAADPAEKSRMYYSDGNTQRILLEYMLKNHSGAGQTRQLERHPVDVALSRMR